MLFKIIKSNLLITLYIHWGTAFFFSSNAEGVFILWAVICLWARVIDKEKLPFLPWLFFFILFLHFSLYSSPSFPFLKPRSWSHWSNKKLTHNAKHLGYPWWFIYTERGLYKLNDRIERIYWFCFPFWYTDIFGGKNQKCIMNVYVFGKRNHHSPFSLL